MSKNRGSHKDLILRQKSMDMVQEVYNVSKNFPKEELFSLTSQIRRAAISVPANIAEGNTKSSNIHFKQYLETALGSLIEVSVFLEIASRLNYINLKILQKQLEINQEIQRLIGGLLSSLSK